MKELSDAELLEIITEGRNTMPGFGAVLTPEDRAALLEFVRSLSEESR